MLYVIIIYALRNNNYALRNNYYYLLFTQYLFELPLSKIRYIVSRAKPIANTPLALR